jgi:hypothetical protein
MGKLAATLAIGLVIFLQIGLFAANQAVNFSNSARPGGLTAQQSEVVTTLQPVLTWSPYPKALFYIVTIFSVDNPQNSIYSTYPQPVRDVSFKVPAGVLKSGGKYFWNVIAVERPKPSEGGTATANRYFRIEQPLVTLSFPGFSVSFLDPATGNPTNLVRAEPIAIQPQDQMGRWKIIQELQWKILEIQQDVAANKAKTQDALINKWDEFIRAAPGLGKQSTIKPDTYVVSVKPTMREPVKYSIILVDSKGQKRRVVMEIKAKQ